MTDDDMRRTLAECCGWSIGPPLRNPKGEIENNHYSESWRLPDYMEDLNAIHKAEIALLTTPGSLVDYDNQLCKVTGYSRPICADAYERAKALLLTLGKWKDEIPTGFIHGENCPKVPHKNRNGHLHDENDDRPYDVDLHGTRVTDWKAIDAVYEVTDFGNPKPPSEPIPAKPDLIAHGLWPDATNPVKAKKKPGEKAVIKKPYDVMSPKLRDKVLKRDGYLCKTCGTADDLTIDHIVPRAKGGSSAIDNLQVLCWDCNQVKKDYLNDISKPG